MKTLHRPLVLAAWLVVAQAAATAQGGSQDHPGHPPSTEGNAVPVAAEMTEGEVRRIDRDNGRLTLRHGEMRHLDMPGMTMVFEVRSPGLIDGLKVGDRVRFRAEHVEGAFVVTAIEPAGPAAGGAGPAARR